ncbi:hypothetical protein BDN70DRAFT_935267 [Pholiota conissans]|uniref:Uncharacterized protein n=1 Tax=Pholiota conissans TaxID=109636 RepID=A0A9P6CQR7_9AGAR|nr:hypothetical protein BDN70DRAFT_935267 [Pholiota conissans]
MLSGLLTSSATSQILTQPDIDQPPRHTQDMPAAKYILDSEARSNCNEAVLRQSAVAESAQDDEESSPVQPRAHLNQSSLYFPSDPPPCRISSAVLRIAHPSAVSEVGLEPSLRRIQATLSTADSGEKSFGVQTPLSLETPIISEQENRDSNPSAFLENEHGYDGDAEDDTYGAICSKRVIPSRRRLFMMIRHRRVSALRTAQQKHPKHCRKTSEDRKDTSYGPQEQCDPGDRVDRKTNGLELRGDASSADELPLPHNARNTRIDCNTRTTSPTASQSGTYTHIPSPIDGYTTVPVPSATVVALA